MKENIKDKLKQFFLQQKEVYGIDGYYIENPINLEKIHSGNVSRDKKQELFNNLYLKIKNCKKCHLWKTRLNSVPGEGNINTKLIFVGEGPGYEEDHQGRPFVGRAGELLTKIITAMGFNREEVYITNIVKCHPMQIPNPELRGNDRPPNEEEINSCLPYLEEQIKIIQPKVICCLGSVSATVLTKNDLPISELRGKMFKYYNDESILIVPTYHPAALLRNPGLKKLLWQDMKFILKLLGTPISEHNKKSEL